MSGVLSDNYAFRDVNVGKLSARFEVPQHEAKRSDVLALKIAAQSHKIAQPEASKAAHTGQANPPSSTESRVTHLFNRIRTSQHGKNAVVDKYMASIQQEQQSRASKGANQRAEERGELQKFIGSLALSQRKVNMGIESRQEFQEKVMKAADQLAELSLHAGGSPGIQKQLTQMESSLQKVAQGDPKLENHVAKEMKAAKSLEKAVKETGTQIDSNTSLEKFLAGKGVSKDDIALEARTFDLSIKTAQVKLAKRAIILSYGGIDPSQHTPSFAKGGEKAGIHSSVMKACYSAFKENVRNPSSEGKEILLKDHHAIIYSMGREVHLQRETGGEGAIGAGAFKITYLLDRIYGSGPRLVMQQPHTPDQMKAFGNKSNDSSSTSTLKEQKTSTAEDSDSGSSFLVDDDVIVHGEEETDLGSNFLIDDDVIVHGEEEDASSGSSFLVDDDVIVHGEEEADLGSSFLIDDDVIVHGEEEDASSGSSFLVDDDVIVHGEEEESASTPHVKGDISGAQGKDASTGVSEEQASNIFKMFAPATPAAEDKSDVTLDTFLEGMTKNQLAKVKDESIKELQKNQLIPVDKADMTAKEAAVLLAKVSGQKEAEGTLQKLIPVLSMLEESDAFSKVLKANKKDRTEAEEYNDEVDLQMSLSGKSPYIESGHTVVVSASGEKKILKSAAGIVLPDSHLFAVDLEKMHENMDVLSSREQILALGVLRDSMKGLEELHSMGFIHRDIKPANFLITTQGRGQVTDFGTMVRVDGTDGRKGEYVGTPFFSPPESSATYPQYRKTDAAIAKLDGKMDVWSVGISLHLLLGEELTDHPAFAKYKDKEEPTPEQAMAELHIIYARKGAREQYQTRCDAYVQGAQDGLQREVRELIAGCTHADPTQRLSMTEARVKLDALITKIQQANS